MLGSDIPKTDIVLKYQNVVQLIAMCQALAGVEPIDAVKYQLMIMFLIAGGTGLGTLAAVIAGGRLLTDRRHRLRLDRITTEGER